MNAPPMLRGSSPGARSATTPSPGPFTSNYPVFGGSTAAYAFPQTPSTLKGYLRTGFAHNRRARKHGFKASAMATHGTRS